MDTQAKLGAMRRALCSYFHEREGAVDCLLLAALTGHHALVLGPPGTGKSALVRAFVACVDGARGFDTTFTAFMPEDEVCGPVKLSALRLDRIERATAGMLPDAEVAFLDEIFKASAACLQAMLPVLNERLYRGQPCPLRFAVGASNELPAEDSLGALFDRFVMRTTVDYLSAERAWLTLMATDAPFAPPVKLTLAELDAARAALVSVAIPDAALTALATLRAQLATHGVVVSDRRWVQCRAVLRAAAYLAGDAVVTTDHFAALEHALWTRPEDRDRIAAVLRTVARSRYREAVEVIDAAMRRFAERPSGESYAAALPALADVLVSAAKAVKAMAADMPQSAKDRLAPMLAELRAAHGTLQADLAKRFSM